MWTTDVGVNGIHGCLWKEGGNTHGNERWSWKREGLSYLGQEQAQKIWTTFWTTARGHLKLLERLVVSSLISVAMIVYPNRKQLMRERDIFAWQFQVTIYRSRDVTSAGACSSVSHPSVVNSREELNADMFTRWLVLSGISPLLHSSKPPPEEYWHPQKTGSSHTS